MRVERVWDERVAGVRVRRGWSSHREVVGNAAEGDGDS